MDRGPLSQAETIAASRDFICIRPLTYEDKAEADYLRKVWSRRGALENTAFGIMDPKGSKYLAGPGRGPEFLMGPPEDTNFSPAADMKKLAEPYLKAAKAPRTLPVVKNLRLAMNVAACDNLPLVITREVTPELAKLSWSTEFIGKFVYVVDATQKEDLSVMQPEAYGSRGPALFSGAVSAETLRAGWEKFKPLDKSDHRGHLSKGVQLQIRWKPAVPAEDAQQQAATQRLWGGS
jgi:hypothetical protein